MPRVPCTVPARRRASPRVAGLALVVGAVVVGCGDDGTSPVTSISAADCPFSGAADPVEGGSEDVARSTLTAVETDKDGCVDVVTLRMASGTGPWTAAYAEGPVVGADGVEVPLVSAEALVVTLWGATSELDGEGTTGVATGPLDYVEELLVVPRTDHDELHVVLGVADRLPFEVSGVEGDEVLEVRTG